MDQYDKLFYLRKDRKNRLIPVVSALDDEGVFHAWVPQGEELLDVKVIDLVDGQYFAKAAGSDKDIYFSFLDFLYQRNIVKDIFPFLDYITNDTRNLATSLRKLEIYFTLQDKEKDICRFVVSELEYILGVCRSMYDHFQFIAQKLWDNIQLIDQDVQKKALKKSFSKMVLKGDQIRSSEELAGYYGLPPNLAKFYFEEAAFFKVLRQIRDDIVHRGLTPKHIYITERGFAINIDHRAFAAFGVWANKDCYVNDNLASLKPVIAYIIKKTFDVMGRFTDILSKTIQFPDEIAPGYHLYMRGENLIKLTRLGEYIEKDVWYSNKVATEGDNDTDRCK